MNCHAHITNTPSLHRRRRSHCHRHHHRQCCHRGRNRCQLHATFVITVTTQRPTAMLVVLYALSLRNQCCCRTCNSIQTHTHKCLYAYVYVCSCVCRAIEGVLYAHKGC